MTSDSEPRKFFEAPDAPPEVTFRGIKMFFYRNFSTKQEAQLMLTTRSTLTRPCRISDGLTAHTTLTKAIKYSNI